MIELPKRVHPRLKNFDYSENGMYFVTVCTAEKKNILCDIIVGRGLAPAETRLSSIGRIAEEQILTLPNRYSCIEIIKYVIMPDHIHILLFIDGYTAGASPRPTLSDVICSFKSLTTRKVKDSFQVNKLWQTSFYDHIIRSEEDYKTHWRYIEDNPTMWLLNKYNI
ncbi:MAG: hypothetical protein E7540_05670 [Ruminococcaceae bacterium]|nr:hypothetical protein [Oscillospiraceae bacterium]